MPYDSFTDWLDDPEQNIWDVPPSTNIHLFSNASEYDCWMAKNCYNCAKHRPDAVYCDEFVCQIDHAITNATSNGGTVTHDIALRMGMDEDQSYGWQWKQQCPEFEQCQSWYSVIEFEGKKQLGLGPFDSEQEAIASVTELRKLLAFLKADMKSFDPAVTPETVNVIIEHLPTRDVGQLAGIYSIVKSDGRLK